MPETDQELVLKALEGDRDAFQQIILRYQRMVFNIAFHYLGRRDEVEDVAQEVFLKLFQTLPRYDSERPLKHWIGKITANRCVDELRKKRIRKVHLLSDLREEDKRRLDELSEMAGESHHLTQSDAENCFDLLVEAMAVLSDKDRMAFVLRELEDLTYPELAAFLETSEVAVRIRVSRARKRLQKELGRLLYEK